MPLLGALRESTEESRIRALMRGMDSHPENAETVRKFVLDGGGIAYAEKRLSDFIETALEALSPLPETEEKSYLAKFALFMAGREK